MKKIILGKYAGFCPGVKNAWNLVVSSLDGSEEIYILGELIHNRQAIEKLEALGAKTVEKIADLEGKRGKVVIRAHGEPPETYKRLANLNVKVLDGSCPNVLRAQRMARDLEKEGYLVIVCGEKDHAEALATVGNTKNGIIIESVKDAQNIKKGLRIGVVSQTTFNEDLLAEIVQVLKENATEVKILGTICNFTQLARKEATEIARKSDVVVVVGGRHSSNTKRLAETASRFQKTHHIETPDELEKNWFKNVKVVGLLAGASTPGWIIEETKNTIMKR